MTHVCSAPHPLPGLLDGDDRLPAELRLVPCLLCDEDKLADDFVVRFALVLAESVQMALGLSVDPDGRHSHVYRLFHLHGYMLVYIKVVGQRTEKLRARLK